MEPTEGHRKQQPIASTATDTDTTTTSDLSPTESGSPSSPPSRGLLHDAVLWGDAPAAATDAATSDNENIERGPARNNASDNDNIGGGATDADLSDRDSIGGDPAGIDKRDSPPGGRRSAQAGGGDHPADAAAAGDVFTPIHVAYRHSDLQLVRFRSSGVAGGVSSSSTGKEGATSIGDVSSAGQSRGYGPNASRDGRGRGEAHQHQQQVGGGTDRRSLENEEVREGETEGPFQMPATVASGVGGTWDRGPFGPAPECPSSRKVFQIGVAMDTGFFKVGFDSKGSLYWVLVGDDGMIYSAGS